ncbi:MAG: hypothetical protein JSV30_04765 [Candidatus Omnitrophota bacterium]|nr:MAG: hypothetical protein JSV30_04765 [Candidatus Omnitrophota bacterium]
MKTLSFALLLYLVLSTAAYAYDKTITVPAEKAEGITITLPKGNYRAEAAGGAVALFFPIHPNYSWLYSLCVGTDCLGGQDQPNLGTLYVEPSPKVASQADAENEVLQALKEGQVGATLDFTLKQEKEVRLWVSDFDYSDNMGSERVRIFSLR